MYDMRIKVEIIVDLFELFARTVHIVFLVTFYVYYYHFTSNSPWTSSSSSVRSITEPFGRGAGAAALEGVDPVAWLSEEREKKCWKEINTSLLFGR